MRLPEQAGQQRHERSDRASRGGREPRGGHHGGRASAGHGRLPGLPALIDNAARVVGRLGLTPRQSGQPGRGGVADRLLTTASLPVVCRAPPTRAGRHLRACPPEPCRRTLGARRPERPRRRGMRLRQPPTICRVASTVPTACRQARSGSRSVPAGNSVTPWHAAASVRWRSSWPKRRTPPPAPLTQPLSPSYAACLLPDLVLRRTRDAPKWGARSVLRPDPGPRVGSTAWMSRPRSRLGAADQERRRARQRSVSCSIG